MKWVHTNGVLYGAVFSTEKCALSFYVKHNFADKNVSRYSLSPDEAHGADGDMRIEWRVAGGGNPWYFRGIRRVP